MVEEEELYENDQTDTADDMVEEEELYENDQTDPADDMVEEEELYENDQTDPADDMVGEGELDEEDQTDPADDMVEEGELYLENDDATPVLLDTTENTQDLIKQQLLELVSVETVLDRNLEKLYKIKKNLVPLQALHKALEN